MHVCTSHTGQLVSVLAETHICLVFNTYQFHVYNLHLPPQPTASCFVQVALWVMEGAVTSVPPRRTATSATAGVASDWDGMGRGATQRKVGVGVAGDVGVCSCLLVYAMRQLQRVVE